MRINTGILAGAGLFIASIGAGPAQAQSSCQTDFQKLLEPRMALVQRINGFAQRRPTAQVACSTLSQLVAQDGKLNKWIEENKDWCQIPDNVVEQFKTGAGQASRARGQACGAARQQASAVARARAQQRAAQGGGPAPVGSGVRLPQGAL
jgi:hypothetical protein